MRLSRNRNWGNPALIDFIARLGEAAKKEGWNGLLIGDMAQPRGGPMFSGHASHQIGLDVDIWFNPMPDHVMTREERELDGATNMVALSGLDVDHSVWTPARTALIKAAARDPQVARIFVNAAIKKAMCAAAGTDRDWLAKVRPWWGHAEHFHVRLNCPPDSPQCESQAPVGPGDGCGHELDYWFKDSVLHPKPAPGPPSPRTGPTLGALPRACRQVVTAP
jgi:penicillin-insensitive murein endopeptidase